ncbi:MAG TPA: hypothetical protein QGF05_02540 [Dehalococcoidia bacterium]|nr:hypothetical protein [Dehalococcoidia bacterium]
MTARFPASPVLGGALLLAAGLMVVALIAAACGGNGNAETDPPSDSDVLVDAPPLPPPRIPGVLVELPEDDGTLLPGFGAIQLSNDIPGHLREHDDQILAQLGELARGPDRLRQAFQNLREEKFVFTVQIRMRDDQDAIDAVSHIRTLDFDAVLQFIAPDEDLFEGHLEPIPEIGPSPNIGPDTRLTPDEPVPNTAVHFFLRHGFSNDRGVRLQDVGNDIIVFARGGTVVFIEGRSPQDVDSPTRVNNEILELARVLADSLDSTYAAKVAAQTPS